MRFVVSSVLSLALCTVGCATAALSPGANEESSASKEKSTASDVILSTKLFGPASRQSSCSDHSQCQLGYCIEGACRPCETDEHCDEGVCDQGLCRPSMDNVCHAECVSACTDDVSKETCEAACDKACDS